MGYIGVYIGIYRGLYRGIYIYIYIGYSLCGRGLVMFSLQVKQFGLCVVQS